MKIKESVVLQRRTYLTFILVIGLIICLRTTRKRHLNSRMRHSTVLLCGPRSNESFHTSLNLSITTNYSVLHFSVCKHFRDLRPHCQDSLQHSTCSEAPLNEESYSFLRLSFHPLFPLLSETQTIRSKSSILVKRLVRGS